MKGLSATLLVSLLVLLGATPSFGQGAIEGTVRDSTSGETLPGASVRVVGTQQGASTDVNGTYRIEGLAAGTYALQASFVGYGAETQEQVVVRAGETTTVDFGLQANTETLEEVVVVGYGTQEREDVTGSISSVSAQDLEDDVSTSIDEALQGRVAGVTVTRNTGRPGGSVSIRVRGLSTLTTGNAEPLYVIDGVPINGDSGNGITNPLATINPQDVESIDILKDASAAAIYGSRASNGVVLITTKSGTAGELNVSYNGSVGTQSLPKEVGVLGLREYAQVKSAWSEVAGTTLDPGLSDPSLLGDGTDWQDVLFRRATTTDHNLAVSGGTEDTQFRLSGGYTFQNGIAIESGFDRYSLNAKLNNQSTDWLNIGGNLNLSRTQQDLNVSQDDVVNLTIRQRPDIAAVTPDGGYGGPTGDDDSQFGLNNPLGLARLNTNQQTDFQSVGGVHLNVSFLDNLTLNNELNASYNSGNADIFRPTYEFGGIVSGDNESTRSSSSSTYWQVRNYLNYVTGLANDDIGIDATAGHEIQETQFQGLTGGRRIFPSNTIPELPAGDASTATNSSYSGSNSLQSVFGRLRLDYLDRYLLTSNFRADASSRFSEAHRWGYFPSVAVAWKVQEEPFMENVDFVDQLKLRAGLGQVGNESIGNYLYGDTYQIIATDFGNGVRAQTLGNPDLKWETTTTTNLGVDLGLLNQRFNLSVDAYQRKISDLLLQVELPGYSGTGGNGEYGGFLLQPTRNIGSMRNRGLEFALNTVNFTGDGGGFGWETNLTLSLNKNEVTALNQENAFLDATVNEGGTQVIFTRATVGEPAPQFYGYKVAGMFRTQEELEKAAAGEDGYALPEQGNSGEPQSIDEASGTWLGDLRFEDLNGDGVINADDRTFIGNPNPDFQYGITNRFSYKNFDLSVFLNGNYGNEIFNQIRRLNENPSGGSNGIQYGNVLEETADYARIGRINPDGPDDLDNLEVKNDTDVPRLSLSDPNDNQRISDRFVEDGSYLRIQNVTLGYVLPAEWVSRLSLQRLRVYASASNLYTLTGYSGYDPEIGEAQDDDLYSAPSRALLQGVDFGRYPSPRTFTFGVNLTF